MEYVGEIGIAVVAGLLILLNRHLSSLEGKIVAKVFQMIKDERAALEKERYENILCARRISIIDRILSKFTDKDFDSRSIVDSNADMPREHPAIREIISKYDGSK